MLNRSTPSSDSTTTAANRSGVSPDLRDELQIAQAALGRDEFPDGCTHHRLPHSHLEAAEDRRQRLGQAPKSTSNCNHGIISDELRPSHRLVIKRCEALAGDAENDVGARLLTPIPIGSPGQPSAVNVGLKPQKCDGHHSYWQGADLASIRDQEAPMRTNTGFAAGIAAAIMMGLAVGFWIVSSVDETTASVRTKATAPTTRVIHSTPTPYLSVREMEPVY